VGPEVPTVLGGECYADREVERVHDGERGSQGHGHGRVHPEFRRRYCDQPKRHERQHVKRRLCTSLVSLKPVHAGACVAEGVAGMQRRSHVRGPAHCSCPRSRFPAVRVSSEGCRSSPARPAQRSRSGTVPGGRARRSEPSTLTRVGLTNYEARGLRRGLEVALLRHLSDAANQQSVADRPCGDEAGATAQPQSSASTRLPTPELLARSRTPAWIPRKASVPGTADEIPRRERSGSHQRRPVRAAAASRERGGKPHTAASRSLRVSSIQA